MKTTKPTDDEILAALGTSSTMTYVIANRISMSKQRPYDCAFIRRRLTAMEKVGKVKRIPSSYAVMICWVATPGDATLAKEMS